MNEELERHVENTVGELRAFAWRKRRIREELLAHLLAIHDEEIARGAASDAATATAIARWGNTRELASALQRSVPTLERIAMRPLPALDGLDWTKKASESRRTSRLAGQ
jgi:hypothetical protein